ncbi:hypothetical protein [Streptomyces sp. TLI_146]|uniref:hypothetical protein n=1 Tax=Streptomyces sp. TLI_146 TaxID=1938858 RepID=UPI000C710B71|nr:hypothetical protein [Streptomyces sp. TLI_146]PKV88189.1 hypothetical protein BX283_5800 [Streptomyces sp. TLI_146]
MDLEFVGIDPNTGGGGSPTVWIEDEAAEIVVQGWKADARLEATICGTDWVPGHTRGIPDHEAVVRIPVRMVPILREACDVAERAGLHRPAKERTAERGPLGDA